ncbi:MAG: Host attachment protein [Alphaproteobacteria bacterium]|jgi:protein required for attachment to host cells|nr:Host attachment protein [Alphaproteobacteria bacterium]
MRVIPTLFVIADGGKARFLVNDGPDDDLQLRPAAEFHNENPPTREQGTDKPGRIDDAGKPVGGTDVSIRGRSAMGETDWHQFEKERFAKEIAGHIDRSFVGGSAYERLVLVAPPQVLGDLRKELHKDSFAKVTVEVAKDLTNHRLDDIESRLSDSLRPDAA